jgi:antitoxin VapB
MALNIKDEETHQLVTKLAKLTGESLTLAVKISVKERLERQEQSSRGSGRLERIRKIVERTAPLMNDDRSSKELFDELYDDETGLPK